MSLDYFHKTPLVVSGTSWEHTGDGGVSKKGTPPEHLDAYSLHLDLLEPSKYYMARCQCRSKMRWHETLSSFVSWFQIQKDLDPMRLYT